MISPCSCSTTSTYFQFSDVFHIFLGMSTLPSIASSLMLDNFSPGFVLKVPFHLSSCPIHGVIMLNMSLAQRRWPRACNQWLTHWRTILWRQITQTLIKGWRSWWHKFWNICQWNDVYLSQISVGLISELPSGGGNLDNHEAGVFKRSNQWTEDLQFWRPLG